METPSQLPRDICECVERILALVAQQTGEVQAVREARDPAARENALTQLRGTQINIRAEGHKLRAWMSAARATGAAPQRQTLPASALELHPAHPEHDRARFLASLHTVGDHTLDPDT